LEKFEKYTMCKNDDFHGYLKRIEAKGLECIHDTNEEPMVITSLEYI